MVFILRMYHYQKNKCDCLALLIYSDGAVEGRDFIRETKESKLITTEAIEVSLSESEKEKMTECESSHR